MRLWSPWRRSRFDEDAGSAADEALRISERQRQRAAEQRREFQRKAARMRRMREHNHLGEAFERAFGEGR